MGRCEALPEDHWIRRRPVDLAHAGRWGRHWSWVCAVNMCGAIGAPLNMFQVMFVNDGRTEAQPPSWLGHQDVVHTKLTKRKRLKCTVSVLLQQRTTCHEIDRNSQCHVPLPNNEFDVGRSLQVYRLPRSNPSNFTRGIWNEVFVFSHLSRLTLNILGKQTWWDPGFSQRGRTDISILCFVSVASLT